MNRIAVFVGLDYHQAGVQVCVLDGAGKELGNRKCENCWWEIQEYAERFGEVAAAAIESCTGAADLAEELVQEAGWSVELAHPGYVARMKQNPDKSDYSDARLLADLTRVGYLPRVWLAPQAVRELRRLVRYRQQLVNERRAWKLRISAALRDQRRRCPEARPWTLAWLAWLQAGEGLSEESRWIIGRQLARIAQIQEELKAVRERLRGLTEGDEVVGRLRALRGVGEVTAWVLRAEIGRFERFRTGKQLARYCGLSPRNASSGERQADAGLVKAANGALRVIVVEAAQRLIRFEPRWNQLAQRLLRTGKPKSVVVAAVGNRWLRWLYYQMLPIPTAA